MADDYDNGLEHYDVTILGIDHTLQLDQETADRLGDKAKPAGSSPGAPSVPGEPPGGGGGTPSEPVDPDAPLEPGTDPDPEPEPETRSKARTPANKARATDNK